MQGLHRKGVSTQGERAGTRHLTRRALGTTRSRVSVTNHRERPSMAGRSKLQPQLPIPFLVRFVIGAFASVLLFLAVRAHFGWYGSVTLAIFVAGLGLIVLLLRATSRRKQRIYAGLALVAVLASLGLYLYSQAQRVSISGVVSCASGLDVEGVYVAALGGGSGFATWHANQEGWRATYSYVLPNGGPYAMHIGCGGTPKVWGTVNRSPEMTTPHIAMKCFNTRLTAHRANVPPFTCWPSKSSA
jgi:hypothetical protein